MRYFRRNHRGLTNLMCRRGVMGGVYTAPTLLILLYLSGIERALLLSFHNNALYSSVLRALSAKHLAWRTRAVSSVFYCISCIIVTLTLWYLTHRSLSGHSTWVTDMLPITLKSGFSLPTKSLHKQHSSSCRRAS